MANCPFFHSDLMDLNYEEKLQLLRLLNCFAKISYLKHGPDSDITTLSCRNEEDLVLFKLNCYLGEALPPAFIPVYNYLKDNYCQELLEDGGVYPSQEYLCEVYPRMLRKYLPFSDLVMNCKPPFSNFAKRKVRELLKSLNVQSVCDLTANGNDADGLLSSVLRWMIQENNSVEEDPTNLVLYDAVINYDFLYYGMEIFMPEIEASAKDLTDRFVVVITRLTEYQSDFLKGGKLASVQLLEWNSKKEEEVYLLAFDLHGGHDKVDYPEEGKSFTYQELLANGGKLDYESVGIKWAPKPIGWKPKPIKRD